MNATDHPTKISRLYKFEKFLSMSANAVVIAGIIVALIQFYHAKNSERVQNAINAINQTRTSEFLKAYARVKTAYNTKKADDSVALIDDLNYVMNTYDNIALLYLNGLADKCVVKNATDSAVKEMSSICDAMRYSKEYRKNFDRLAALMDKEVCE